MSVTNFYTNHEIFITGGSGFIGKALIEKLIRCFPNVGKIFVLIRNKNKKSASERLQEILNTVTFERARKEQPQAFSKIVAIAGDCQELKLGINAEDMERLKNVSLIFHSAASVRFDDHLKYAILLNTRGTHELIKIATSLKSLKAFIHISTSYSHPDRHILEEKMYPPFADWRNTIKLAETYDEEILNIFFSKYSSHQPNTYTFTKSLAEHVINDYRNHMPLMIVRPSIVVSSVEEPFPGWVDNFNGPIGMLVACGMGLLRTNYANPNVVMDLIPVDVTVKCLLLAAYKLGKEKAIPNTKEVEVINCVNAFINSISLGNLIKKGTILIRENPFEKCLWLPGGSVTRCKFWHFIRFFTFQIGLALMVDILLYFANKKPFLLKLQRRISAANSALYIFITTEWKFCNKKFIELEDIIQPEDCAKLAFMRYTTFSYTELLSNGIRGAKQFLMHEPPEASQQTKLRMKIIFVLHYLLQFIAIYLIAQFLIRYLQRHF